jgi:propionyl-CoA carboxylase alpha chain
MRRYTLGLNGRDFVIDVQELSADSFAVLVGGEQYQVTLAGDETLPTAAITPGYAVDEAALAPVHAAAAEAAPPLPPRLAASARAPAAARPVQSSGAGGVNVLNAPMPGVILALHVKVGDKVQRGQQVAVLDAMKMHNFIGAPRAGTIAEVCVAEGQAVGHGEPIVRFASGG